MNRHIRNIVTGVITGGTILGTAFASSMLRPVPDPLAGDAARTTTTLNILESVDAGDALTPLDAGEAYVGAAKISLEPRPEDYPGAIWETDPAKCTQQAAVQNEDQRAHIADWRTPWIENTNCIYMGGYGLGPSNPIVTWDQQYGLWVRSTVITDAQGDSLVLTLLDAEGYFGNYNRLCGPLEPRCGAFNLAEDLGTELGISPNGFIIASTHAHTALDLIGGWGAVPAWYMDQVSQAIKGSIRQAWANRVPARIEGGEALARGFNGERRSTYHSAQDPTVNWLRAIGRDNATIATVATYATHPVNYSASQRKGHADWPVSAAFQAEANQGGGVASFFQAGLGNMTGGGSWEPKGQNIANKVPAPGGGTLVADPDVRVAREFWNQPVTNGPLGTLGGGGFFDKPFATPADGGPAVINVGKSSAKPCRSASALAARVNVVAAKIGPIVITSAPGEIFANYSNTIEERSSLTALAIGQANDALGYMPQSFETDHAARQGLGFAGAGFFEYEDAYSIDACFGDMALETTLRLLSTLG